LVMPTAAWSAATAATERSAEMASLADMKRNLANKAGELKRGAGAALDRYEEASKAAPDVKLAADLHPKSGIATSGMDAAVQAKKGNYGQAALEAVGLIPFVKPGVTLAKLGKNALKRKEVAKKAQAADRVNDTVGYVAEKVSGYANGGMVSGRSYGKKC